MGNEPEYIQLSSLISEKPRNGLYKKKEYQGHGHRWIKMKEIYGNDFFLDQETEYLDVTESEIERFCCEPSDLLFGRTSLTLEGVGDCLLVGNVKDTPIFESNLFRVKFDQTKASPLFYYYFFKSQAGKQLIQKIAKQTAAASITSTDLISQFVPYYSLSVQKEIAEFIFSFDARIELNRRMNETFGTMTQTLFKSWFVDFDPIIDNALATGNNIPEALKVRSEIRNSLGNNRKSLPDEIRHEFPSAFKYNDEMGWIPEGWGKRCFSDIADHIRSNVKAEVTDQYDLYVGLEHIGKKQIFLTKSSNGQNIASNKSEFCKYDLLFGKLRPYFHKVCIAPNKGICSTDILVFRAKEDYYHSFMVSVAFSEPYVEYANLRSTGTKMPRANAKDMLAYPIVFPGKKILEVFNKMINPTWEKGLSATRDNTTLSSLRDTLLPKLISGELRIPDAEKLVVEAI